MRSTASIGHGFDQVHLDAPSLRISESGYFTPTFTTPRINLYGLYLKFRQPRFAYLRRLGASWYNLSSVPNQPSLQSRLVAILDAALQCYSTLSIPTIISRTHTLKVSVLLHLPYYAYSSFVTLLYFICKYVVYFFVIRNNNDINIVI